jgi:hypothetical protein
MSRWLSNSCRVSFFFSVLLLMWISNDIDSHRAVKIYDTVVFLTATENIELISLVMAVETINELYMYRDAETYELAWWGAINGLNSSLPMFYDEGGLVEVLEWLKRHEKAGFRISSGNMQHFVRFYDHVRTLYPEIPTEYLINAAITGSVQVFNDPFIFYEQSGNYRAVTKDSVIENNNPTALTCSVIVQEGMCIGYIKLTTFTHGISAQLFTEILANIRKVCVEAEPPIILDLRDNLGGSLETAIEIADLFLEEGVIVIEHHADFDIPRLATLPTEVGDVPLVIITNRWSASASEVLVSALLQREKTYLIGTDPFTYGKSVAQRCGVLLNSKKICVRTFEVLPPTGISYQGLGIAVQHVVFGGETAAHLENSPGRALGLFEFLNEEVLLREAIEYIKSEN